MRPLLKLFLIVAPIELLGLAAGGAFIQWAALVAVAIAALGAFQFVIGNWSFSRADLWALPFVGFLLAAGISLATSPYLDDSASKGLAQMLGVSAFVLFAVTFAHVASRDGKLLLTLIRYSSASLGAIGLIGVAQFAVNNAMGALVVDLRFLNPILGSAWLDPGLIGGLWRTNSITTEPSHMATYLVGGLGVALIRIGMLGPVGRSPEILYIMPAWATVGILGGLAVSMSLIGYIGAIIGVVATLWLGRSFRPRRRRKIRRRRAYLPALAGVGLLGVVLLFSGQGLVEKVQTMTLISAAPALAEQGDARDLILTENVSALAVAINLEVALSNFSDRPMLGAGIGAHPETYDIKAPDYAFLSPIVYKLNSMDAASLLFRLISETGWLGTGCYLLGMLLVVLEGWKTARRCIQAAKIDPDYAVLGAIAVGLTASSATMIALNLMRMGIYFSPTHWESMAFVLAFAMLVVRVLRSAPRPARSLARSGQVEAPAK